MDSYLISIVGPTAIGKTTMSINLAKMLDTEIVSGDSRQFYREMKIGTAVPTTSELTAVSHHFIQHLSITDVFDVGDFERAALKKLAILFKKHPYVVMVGGSGLYVDAVSQGLDEFPQTNPEIRKELNRIFEEEGLKKLQRELKSVDPAYAAKVDLQNHRRIIRALEVYRSSGKPFSSFLNQPKPERPFKTLRIGLDAPREVIYRRIEKRVDLMMEEGLLEEVKSLYLQRNNYALNTIGYKELFAYLEGKYTLEEAVVEIKKNTRRFAKRQLTWFKRNPSIQWFSYDTNPVEIRDYILSQTKDLK